MTTATEPDLADMPVAALLEAIALNSDAATYLEHCYAASDAEADANRAKATAHFARRAACMREVQRRFDALAPGGTR